MLKNRKTTGILMLLIAAGFLAGVIHLFMVRFERGDIYPPYSSLRSDPVGTKVLYESLNNLQGISAVRNYRHLQKLDHRSAPSFFYLGAHAEALSFKETDLDVLESMIAGGGQLVMSFLPEQGNNSTHGKDRQEPGPDECGDPGQEEEYSEHDAGDDPFKTIDLAKRWGFRLRNRKLSCESDCRDKAAGILITDIHGLPDSILWHSALYFEPGDTAWNTVYAVEGLPVLIEKTFGEGKIILSTDTYFLSNEAMLKSRQPGLLTWLIGPNRNIMFDETHLGMVEKPGISSLFRKYSLDRPVAALLLLAMLFVWKNSSSLVPPDSSMHDKDIAGKGKDYISGFISLLRRNVTSGELMSICFNEWKKPGPAKKTYPEDVLSRISIVMENEHQLPAKQRNPLATYQTIHNLLARRRHG